jgi:uncharacterized integral membrane protein
MVNPDLTRRRGLGGILIALLLITVGVYYVLRNTLGFDLAELDGEAIWPILVVILGLGIMERAWSERRESPRP